MIDLDIHKATKKDKKSLVKLIKENDLFVPRMRLDDFFVAYRGENIVGVARFKTHKKFRLHELSNVGVKEGWRKCGIGSSIVNNIISKAKYDVVLNTINPGFYEKLGFSSMEDAPAAIKKNGKHCKGCDKTSCKTMIKKVK